MINDLSAYSTVGAFLLALFIAILGYIQTIKKNEDRACELILMFNESKRKMTSAFSKYLNEDIEDNFDNIRIYLTDHTNSIELFSKMIYNQNLDKTNAFRQFQGNDMKCLSEAIGEVAYFSAFIYKFGFEKFENESADVPTRKNLRFSMSLLESSTTKKEFNDLIDNFKELRFF